ncbi:transposase family protein, partial [Brachybacterium paraconglomeratum]|uniref:transposase family protein n=1 Tax=Brachybacterium paraconglomeratum TaxID=173362 RepID=UPI0022AF0AD8
MHENTGSQRDAASTIFNLPNYQVIDVIDLPDGDRRVVVASTFPPGCPSCGVLATKVHSRRDQRIRDVPIAGSSELSVGRGVEPSGDEEHSEAVVL